MQLQLKDKNDIKIFILYLLRHINYPLDFPSINDIVVQDGFVKYFDFAECFAELLDTGNVEELRGDGEDKYIITARGIHVADNLESRLIDVLKDRSLKSALRLLSFKKRGAEISFDSEKTENGKILLRCSIKENSEEIMSLNLTLDSATQVEQMENNFNDRPEVVYRGILALLSGEVNYLIN